MTETKKSSKKERQFKEEGGCDIHKSKDLRKAKEKSRKKDFHKKPKKKETLKKKKQQKTNAITRIVDLIASLVGAGVCCAIIFCLVAQAKKNFAESPSNHYIPDSTLAGLMGCHVDGSNRIVCPTAFDSAHNESKELYEKFINELCGVKYLEMSAAKNDKAHSLDGVYYYADGCKLVCNETGDGHYYCWKNCTALNSTSIFMNTTINDTLDFMDITREVGPLNSSFPPMEENRLNDDTPPNNPINADEPINEQVNKESTTWEEALKKMRAIEEAEKNLQEDDVLILTDGQVLCILELVNAAKKTTFYDDHPIGSSVIRDFVKLCEFRGGFYRKYTLKALAYPQKRSMVDDL